MKKYLNTVVAVLFLTVPSLYAYNNQWSDNEDYVIVKEANVEAGEGHKNVEVKGANPPICRVGSPVYIKSGHFTWSDTDIVLPGKSGINFSRSYTSKEPLSGMFGNGWISNLESGFIETVKHIDDDGAEEIHYIYRNQNGLRYTFKEVGDTIEAPSGLYYTFKRLSSTSYQVTDESSKVTDTYSNDHIISREDANGNKREYVYDENGLLQSIKDGNGNTLTLTFGGNGYVTAITDQNARTWSYDYDTDGNLVSVTDPLGGQRNYMYEVYQAENDAQSYSHLTKITDEADVVITAVEYETGYTGSNEWINGRVKSYTMGEDTYTYAWDYHFTSYGYVTKSDSLANWTSLSLSESGHIKQYTDAYYRTTRYNIDENNTLTGVTDKFGNDWNQSVDDKGRIVSKTTPLGNKTSLKYEGERRVPSQITSALGHVTKIAYDDKQNPTTVTLPDNSSYKFAYDSKGNVLDATNPSGVKVSTVTYNANSQATSIKNALGDTFSMGYNALGQMTKITDAQGNVTTYTYDILGNLTKTVNAMGHKVVYTYDQSGRLLSLKDPVGNTTTYQYDTYGRLSKVTRPNGRTLTYAYNSANQVTTVTDSAGRETVLTYDKLGNVTKVSRGDAYINYYYDRMVSRMVRAYDSTNGQSVYFAYNADGQVTREYHNGKGVDYTYNADGRLATMTVDGITTTYTRNSLGELTSLSDGTDTFSFAYDANGQRKSITYPNGTQVTYGLNNASQLTTLDNGLEQSSYTYDKNGMMTQKTVDGAGTDYSYDTVGRLTVAGADSYSYDTSGNMLNNAALYDATTNQLKSTATHTYEYDAFGNLSKKTDKTTGDYKVYTWDVWDRLTKVESFDSADVSLKKIEYSYGGLGRRLFKTVDGNTEKYLYSGSNRIETMQGWSTVTQRFIYDEGIDAPLAMVDVTNDKRYYYHRDYLGSITGLSDSSQNVVESYTYDAYGKTVKTSSVETGNPFAYAGREMDEEDLFYYRARYYDPTAGRFLSEDPIGFASGDFNFYRYVLNNPVNYTDPYGHGFWGFVGSVAVGIIAAPVVGVTAATGAVIGTVAYSGYSLVKFMKNAGESMKRNRERRKQIDNSLYSDNPDVDKILRLKKEGINEARTALKRGYNLPGTFVGGPIITSKEDVIVSTGLGLLDHVGVFTPSKKKKNLQTNKRDCK